MFYMDIRLTDDQHAALSAAGLNVEEVTIGSPVLHRHGIKFSSNIVASVMSTLRILEDRVHGRYEAVRNPVTDGYEQDLTEVFTHALPTEDEPVIYMGSDRGIPEVVRSPLETLASESRLGVVYANVGRSEIEHQPCAGLIQVFPLAFPSGVRVTESYRGIAGISESLSIDEVPDGYTPIIDAASNAPLALLRGDAETGISLWLLFQPSSEDLAQQQFEYILYLLARRIHPSLGEVVGFAPFRENAARRRYLAGARARLAKETAEARDSQGIEEELLAAQQSLTVALARQEAWEREQRRLNTTSPDDQLAAVIARMETEFDDLLSSPDFTSIEFEGNRIVVRTVPIEIVHDGIVYEMGRYSIVITSSRVIRMTALDHSSRRDHPHLSEGYPCLGNIAETVSDLLARNEFGLLLPLLVEFLRSYYPEGAYSKIYNMNVPNHPVIPSTPASTPA
jgi:hypothetical protein